MKKIIIITITLFIILIACEKDKNGNKNLDHPVTSIIVDKNNIKWIGTDVGLYYSTEDGYELADISTSGKILSLLYEENSNTLWIGTNNGLLKATINGTEISYIAISSENLSNQVIQASYIDANSRKWFGTEKGISLNHNDMWKNDSFGINLLDNIYSVIFEQLPVNSISCWDNDYYFATSSGRLYRTSGFKESVDAFSGATQWMSPYNGLNITDTMFVVFVDSKGNQWMGGKKGLQVHEGHDPKDLQSFTYYNDELTDNYIHAINEAPDGKIWVGTEKGVSVFDGNSWSAVTEKLPDPFITAITFDHDGSAWIGTKKGMVNIK